jgi:hypothetical protein
MSSHGISKSTNCGSILSGIIGIEDEIGFDHQDGLHIRSRKMRSAIQDDLARGWSIRCRSMNDLALSKDCLMRTPGVRFARGG